MSIIKWLACHTSRSVLKQTIHFLHIYCHTTHWLLRMMRLGNVKLVKLPFLAKLSLNLRVWLLMDYIYCWNIGVCGWCSTVIMAVFRAWPFVLDRQVQPVVISAFRPVNVAGLNIVSCHSITMQCVMRIFRVRLIINHHYWTCCPVSILLLLYIE